VASDSSPNDPPDFDRAVSTDDFERRFLDYAFASKERITAVAVAHALKLPIALCTDRLESLAAADSIHREVDDRGAVYYLLPGREVALAPSSAPGNALAPRASRGDLLGRSSPTPTEAVALTGLVVNACVPGVGSILAGRPKLGLMQLGLFVAGLPLCLVLIGFPMIVVAWFWAVASGYATLRDAQNVSDK
jgi:TM2 domain-containing membrane protein YozV